MEKTSEKQDVVAQPIKHKKWLVVLLVSILISILISENFILNLSSLMNLGISFVCLPMTGFINQENKRYLRFRK